MRRNYRRIIWAWLVYMPCVYLCVHDLWKVISWVHRHPFFCWTSLWKKNAINPRCAIVIYHSLYLVIFLYMQNKFCVFFLFIDSSLMLCSNSALTGGQILSGGGQWRGRQSLDRDHPPPSGSESCCMDGRDDRASLPLHSSTCCMRPVVQLR